LSSNTENNTDIGQVSMGGNYDSAPQILQHQQADQKPDEENSALVDFCHPNSASKDGSNGMNGSVSFVEPHATVQQPQNNSGDQEQNEKKSSNSSTNQHSKLRVLLFDMEDEDEIDDEAIPHTESMTVGDSNLDFSRVDSRETASESVQLDKSKDGRLFKGCSAVGTTANLPTAIVAPTAFSIAANGSNPNYGSSGSTTNSPSCCNSDEMSNEYGKEKPQTPLSASKRKHGQESGFNSSNSPLKQKKCDDFPILATTSSSVTTPSTVLTSGPSMNSRVTTSTHNNTMELATANASINTGTILSLHPPSAGGNRLSVNTTQQMEGITLPVSSAVNCGGNIIICSSSPALQQPQQAIGAWNCQVSLFNLQ
uniref:Homeodomain-interacting protein kinase 2 n=1 Tax=Rodentolepis nana TaxID=102285 RepID=A0A0R3TAC5_RODNA